MAEIVPDLAPATLAATLNRLLRAVSGALSAIAGNRRAARAGRQQEERRPAGFVWTANGKPTQLEIAIVKEAETR
jgi:hypothetical protein